MCHSSKYNLYDGLDLTIAIGEVKQSWDYPVIFWCNFVIKYGTIKDNEKGDPSSLYF